MRLKAAGGGGVHGDDGVSEGVESRMGVVPGIDGVEMVCTGGGGCVQVKSGCMCCADGEGGVLV